MSYWQKKKACKYLFFLWFKTMFTILWQSAVLVFDHGLWYNKQLSMCCTTSCFKGTVGLLAAPFKLNNGGYSWSIGTSELRPAE